MISTALMEDPIGYLAYLQPKKVLLLGDLMQDVYTYGKVYRISPEAPVPVFQITSESSMPGGAGNVALNLAGLRCEVKLVARVGQDGPGHRLVQQLSEMSQGLVDNSYIAFENDYQTPVKNRLIASSQQLLRQDREKPYQEMSEPVRAKLLESALKLLEEVDIVAVSDYGKGGLDRAFLEPIFAKARALGLQVIVDPKSKDFSLYKGASLIKPNLKEALEIKGISSSNLEQIAQDVMSQLPDLEHLLITRSQDGLSLFTKDQSRRDFPARCFEVVDVTGAGDCVLAALVLAIACGMPLEIGCRLANIAGSIAIQRLGCVQLSFKEIARQILKLDTHNKIFDERHLFALSEACKDEKIDLIRVDLEDIRSLDFILFLQKHRSECPQTMLLVEVYTEDPYSEWIDFLAKQEGVDFVILSTNLMEKAGKIAAHRIWQWAKHERCLIPNS